MQQKFWDVVQALAGVYCAILGTVSYLHPPGSGTWGVFAMTIPPPGAIGLAILGISVVGKASSDLYRSARRKEPAVAPQTSAASVAVILPSAKAAYDRLSTAAQIALSIVYRTSLVDELSSCYPTTKLEALENHLTGLGYNEESAGRIISELTATNLVKRDFYDNFDRSTNAEVAASVRAILVDVGMPSLDVIHLLMNEAQSQSDSFLREMANSRVDKVIELEKQILRAESQLELSKGLAALEILKAQADPILTEYRHLDHDHRQEVALPLASSSWPDFGKEWSYVDFRLAHLSERIKEVSGLSEALFDRYKWDTAYVKIFGLKQGTKMLDLIIALEEFLAWKPSSSEAKQ